MALRWLPHLLLLLLYGPPLSAEAAAPVQPPAVTVAGATYHGLWSDAAGTVAGFRGIPFAAAPVGPLRWRAPQPAGLTGPVDATRFAPACLQDDRIVDWYAQVAAAFGHGPDVVGRPTGVSEDCLYLNIWTPRPAAGASLPVLVFVHGGSNVAGWSYEPNYHGDRLAARGMLVVTVAYRLGAFGFFAHPAIGSDAGEAPANFGLLDLEAAFQWLQRNVAAFGGDPGNITAVGESAGALDILDLLLLELEAHRDRPASFRRLVLQSIGGDLAGRQSLADERRLGVRLATELGLPVDVSADELRAAPAEAILAAARALPQGHYFDAVIDGRTLLRQPLDALGELDLSGIELLAGTNRDEWLMYVDADASARELQAWVGEAAPRHREALLAAVAGDDPRRALDRLRTARRMLCPSRFLARRVNAAGGSAWLYWFTRQRPGPGGAALGAYHGAELPYVFDRHDEWLPTGGPDLALTAAIGDYWGRFARTGAPAGDQAWPRFTRQQPAVMELGGRIGLTAAVDEELCALLGPERS